MSTASDMRGMSDLVDAILLCLKLRRHIYESLQVCSIFVSNVTHSTSKFETGTAVALPVAEIVSPRIRTAKMQCTMCFGTRLCINTKEDTLDSDKSLRIEQGRQHVYIDIDGSILGFGLALACQHRSAELSIACKKS